MRRARIAFTRVAAAAALCCAAAFVPQLAFAASVQAPDGSYCTVEGATSADQEVASEVAASTSTELASGAAFSAESRFSARSVTSATYTVSSTITATLSSDGTLTVSGTGAMPDYETGYSSSTYSYVSSAPWGGDGASIRSVVVGSGITYIGAYAFYGLDNLTSASIASTVTNIAHGAFLSSALTQITGMAGVQEFGGNCFANTKLTSFTVPAATKVMGDYMLTNTPVTNVTIGKNVETLSKYVFYLDSSLASISVNSANTHFKMVSGFLTDVDATEIICFPPCTTQTTVTIPGTIKTVPEFAFKNNKNVKSVVMQSGVKEIEDDAFAYMTNLESVVVPASVTSVGKFAFYTDISLTSVKFNASITEFPESLFEGCTSLASLTHSSKLEYVPASSIASTKVTASSFSGFTKTLGGSYLKGAWIVLQSGTYNYKMAYQALKLINEERANQGLDPLVMDSDLLEASMKRAAEQVVSGGHTRPNGDNALTICSKAKGENVALGQTTAAEVVEDWINSSEHYSNIVNADYTSVGLGCFVGNGTVYWVTLFGEDTADAIAQPANKTVTPKILTKKYQLRSDNLEWRSRIEDSYAKGTKFTLEPRTFNAGWNGRVAELGASTFTWKSSNTSVATVSSSGVVKCVGAGTVTITATVKGLGSGYSITCSFEVTESLAKPVMKSAVNTASGISVKWNAVDGAARYRVVRRVAGSSTWKILGSTTGTSFTDKTAVSGKTYYYAVRCLSADKTVLTSARAVGIACPRITQAQVTSVKKAASGTFTAKWNKVTNATYYQVRYSTSSTFATYSTQRVAATKLSSSVSKLKAGKTYYVKVRAYRKIGTKYYYGPWSAVSKVTV